MSAIVCWKKFAREGQGKIMFGGMLAQISSSGAVDLYTGKVSDISCKKWVLSNIPIYQPSSNTKENKSFKKRWKHYFNDNLHYSKNIFVVNTHNKKLNSREVRVERKTGSRWQKGWKREKNWQQVVERLEKREKLKACGREVGEERKTGSRWQKGWRKEKNWQQVVERLEKREKLAAGGRKVGEKRKTDSRW